MPDPLSGCRSRELALNMLLNALDALESRPGEDSRLVARLWIMRATALLKEARSAEPTDLRDRRVETLLVAVSDRLRIHMAAKRAPPAEGRFSRLCRGLPGKDGREP